MKEHYYLDNAATTWPKPETVYTTMDSFFREYGVNPGRAGHDMAVEAERMIVETRRLLAVFFGFTGDPQRVVFTQNATDSLNIAIYGLAAGGGHLISTRLEHNSVLRPLNHLERDHGAAVTRVARDAFGYIDPDDVRKAIRPDTRAVIINHASNVLGSVQDIAAIGKITREAGVPFVIDTCQSAGVLPIDMDAIGIDILTFTGHKGLFGPMGIGGMIVREGVDLPPARVGGTGVDSISPFQPDEYPYHLEAGTVSIPGIAGLNAAQKWFAELGREQLGDVANGADHAQACAAALSHIDARERAHVTTLENAFRDTPGVTVYGPGNNGPRVATLSMNVDALPADQVGAMLDADHHVCVRPGLHCAPLVHEDEGTVAQKGTVRFAPGYFSNEEDLQQAIDGIRDIVG
ncbi:MAG: aminotransferase class V-fold PLP-dependent enzyme [Gammaproteobacteria bacterium]|nr:aminotransferase class V-fold PLP-dependent enzyme [Gammaproteobacteria bacterium]